MRYGVKRDELITIEVRKGQVVKVIGGKGAEYLNETFKSFNDPQAYNLVEFEVGLNPAAASMQQIWKIWGGWDSDIAVLDESSDAIRH